MSGPAVLRAPNHLGDVVMAVPALRASGGADVLVMRWLGPLLELLRDGDREAARPPAFGDLVLLDRGTPAMLRVAARLRGRRYPRSVLLTPSFSSALLFRMAGVPVRRGTASDKRRALLTDAVEPGLLRGAHRASSYCALVTGELPAGPPVPDLTVPRADRARWAELAGEGGATRVGIFPGSNASSRRWDVDRFAALGRRLAGQGVEVVVFGGAGERELTAAAAGAWGRDFGGRTDLRTLAAGLASCALVVSNDSGPLHLAAAVGAPTVSLWGAGDPAVTGVIGARHRLLRHADLPCVPCVRNECPREGTGYRLAEAERECLRLITVDEVDAAVRERLAATLSDGRKRSCPETSAGS